MNQIEQAKVNQLRERLTGAAQGMAAAAAWIDRNADALAKVGVGDFRTALLGKADEDGLQFFVYGGDDEAAQTFAAVRDLLPGKWEFSRSTLAESLECEITDDGYPVEFHHTIKTKTAPDDGAESKV